MLLYEHMTVIGVGLLGGSLAQAARKRGLAGRITGFGRSAETLKRAQREGVIDAWHSDIQAAVQDADLVVLCSPVGTFLPRVREMQAALKPGGHVTDVGSVKGALVRDLDACMPRGVHFVGAHPIAGSERSGLDASHTDLFEGARCIITPTAGTEVAALEKVTRFWEGVGMDVVQMDPDEHDLVLAAVSHLPHAVAFALVNAVAGVRTARQDGVFGFSGGGLRDITRIAASDPVMWRDIFLFNRDPVMDLIDRFQDTLSSLRGLIENGDAAALEKTFALANENRMKLVGMNE